MQVFLAQFSILYGSIKSVGLVQRSAAVWRCSAFFAREQGHLFFAQNMCNSSLHKFVEELARSCIKIKTWWRILYNWWTFLHRVSTA